MAKTQNWFLRLALGLVGFLVVVLFRAIHIEAGPATSVLGPAMPTATFTSTPTPTQHIMPTPHTPTPTPTQHIMPTPHTPTPTPPKEAEIFLYLPLITKNYPAQEVRERR